MSNRVERSCGRIPESNGCRTIVLLLSRRAPLLCTTVLRNGIVLLWASILNGETHVMIVNTCGHGLAFVRHLAHVHGLVRALELCASRYAFGHGEQPRPSSGFASQARRPSNLSARPCAHRHCRLPAHLTPRMGENLQVPSLVLASSNGAPWFGATELPA